MTMRTNRKTRGKFRIVKDYGMEENPTGYEQDKIVVGGKTVGYANWTITTDEEGTIPGEVYLANIDVAPRREGLGRIAVAELERMFRSKGYHVIYLSPFSGVEGFWAKMGYTPETQEFWSKEL
jgi:predicted acetyltransferase